MKMIRYPGTSDASRIGRHAVAVGLLVGLGACANMMGDRSSATTHTYAATQPTVAPAMVRQVQAKLRDGGYYKQGLVDGVWGSGTEAAVRSFQHDHNMGATGQLDVPTLQALNLASGSTAGNYPANTGSGLTQPMRSDPAMRTDAPMRTDGPMRTDPGLNSSAVDNTTTLPPR